MDLQRNKRKRIHFVGIKGVGMAPLAIIAKEAGFDVSGCDVSEVFITDELLKKAGVKILTGFSKDHLKGVSELFATGAHGGASNPEVIAAAQLDIPIMTQGEALAKFQSGEFFGKKNFGISVAGSHGKTTTTAMIAVVLKSAGLDPSFAVGTGYIPYLESNGHFGKGNYFVAEADEYAVDAESNKTPKFLLQNPDIILITNVDFDHPDIYKNFEDIEKAFLDFAKKLGNKPLVINGDGQKNRDFLKKFGDNRITYGVSPDNNYVVTKITYSGDQMFFRAQRDGVDLGEFVLNIFGEQNVLNALGTIASSIEIGLSIPQIKEGLKKFQGVKRRSELIGKSKNGALIYDDYAHHPEEIGKTLNSFRKKFSKEKIICVFQPHMYSRTKVLLSEFINSFSDADAVIISEIFPSFREQKDPNFSAELIAEGINNNKKNKALFFSNLESVVKYFDENPPDSHNVVITMGAGDVYKVASKLLTL